MGEIISISNNETALNEAEAVVKDQFDLVEVSDNMMAEVRKVLGKNNSLSVPIAQLATLGAGVSSLLPALRTVTQTTTTSSQGLYQLANAGVGDALKVAKNGDFWGAFKTAEGGSKFVQLKAAGPVSSTTKTVMSINPAIMMMAVALFSIEQQLGKIEDMENQIISFLEIEKESEIEADVETLANIINKYKHNWDNEHYVSSNHKMVLDIQRTARKNMRSYQKKVTEVLESKQLIIAQSKVKSTLKDLQKKFQYYRISLYNFSMASLIEIMLSGNYKEESIQTIRDEIENRSLEYRDIFSKCSDYLEKMTGATIETNVLKGVGTASRVVGKLIANIPVVKEGPVNEFLQDSGEKMKKNAQGIEQNVVESFAAINNPGTSVFIEKMNDMIQIYNHTSDICFDDKNIYLIAG